MKILIRWILMRWPALRPRAMKWLLERHNSLYRYISVLAAEIESGVHPKHRITAYHRFFLDNIAPGESVLDIGCGKGELLFDIASAKAGRSIGIESNPASASAARQLLAPISSASVLEGDAWVVDYGSPIDVVTLSNVLEHLDHRPEFLMMLQKKYVPKRILVRVPMVDRDWLVPYKREHAVEHRLDDTHEIEYTYADFVAEIQQAGLTVLDSYVRWGEIYAVLERRQ